MMKRRKQNDSGRPETPHKDGNDKQELTASLAAKHAGVDVAAVVLKQTWQAFSEQEENSKSFFIYIISALTPQHRPVSGPRTNGKHNTKTAQ